MLDTQLQSRTRSSTNFWKQDSMPDRSGDYTPSLPLASNGRGSPASHVDAVALQREMASLAYRIFVLPSSETPIDTSVLSSLLPTYVESSSFTKASHAFEVVALTHRLLSAIESEPLEDGIRHPAEDVLDAAFRLHPTSSLLAWVQDIALDTHSPTTAASVLRCLGRRARPANSSWRAALVKGALSTDEVDVRDAAVQAAESWGDVQILGVLRSHVEQVRWLRTYTEYVIEDMES